MKLLLLERYEKCEKELGKICNTIGAIIYFAVWLLSNTLTILCLLVPASLGPVVKSCRLSLFGFLHTLSVYYPGLTLLFSIAIIIVAFWVCRWAFRLAIWGGIYSFDLLTLAWRRHKPGLEPMVFVIHRIHYGVLHERRILHHFQHSGQYQFIAL